MRYPLLVAGLAIWSGTCAGQTLSYYIGTDPAGSNASIDSVTHFAIEYPETPGAYTMVFAHVAIDPAVFESTSDTDRRWLSGVFDVYPFLAPVGWRSQPGFAMPGYSITWDGGPASQAIPTDRLTTFFGLLASHLEQLPNCGTNNQTTAPVARRLPDDGMWPAWVANSDERFPLVFTARKAVQGGAAFDLAAFANNSVLQAATSYGDRWSLAVVAEAVSRLNATIGSETGYMMSIQAVEITPPGNGQSLPALRFKPPAVIRRLSLKQHEIVPWDTPTWVPWLVDCESNHPTGVNLYLASRDNGTQRLVLAFAQPHADLFALCETASGTIAVPQAGPAVQSVRPEGAVYLVEFACPTLLTSMTVVVGQLVEETQVGVQITAWLDVPPLGAWQGAALVWSHEYFWNQAFLE